MNRPVYENKRPHSWPEQVGTAVTLYICIRHLKNIARQLHFIRVIPRRLNFIRWRFGTLCLFHLHRRIVTKNSSYLSTYEDGTDSVPKRRHIKFTRRGITQKRAYNIQNTVNVWNQEYTLLYETTRSKRSKIRNLMQSVYCQRILVWARSHTRCRPNNSVT